MRIMFRKLSWFRGEALGFVRVYRVQGLGFRAQVFQTT